MLSLVPLKHAPRRDVCGRKTEYPLDRATPISSQSCVYVCVFEHTCTHTHTREEVIRVCVCEDPDKLFTATPQGQ